jgi:hypothetical protein
MTITTNASFGINDLTSKNEGGCPIIGCKTAATEHPKGFRFCPKHGLKIHKKTFAYYNGDEKEDKRNACLRNMLPPLRKFAGDYVLGNSSKAESFRLGHENSEDALTYNVFGWLHYHGHLHHIYKWLTGETVASDQLQLFLWGLKINFAAKESEKSWSLLDRVRNDLEKGIHSFLTEPDILLLSPTRLVCIEAKFSSGNPLCVDGKDKDGEKPKSRAKLIERYIEKNKLWPQPTLTAQDVGGKVHSQLLRMFVFTSTMAQLHDPKPDWQVVNLVGKTQWSKHGAPDKEHDFQDPTSSVPQKVASRFKFTSWEELYRKVIAGNRGLQELASYMQNKTANLEKAFNFTPPSAG